MKLKIPVRPFVHVAWDAPVRCQVSAIVSPTSDPSARAVKTLHIANVSDLPGAKVAQTAKNDFRLV